MTRLTRLGICTIAATWLSCANLEDDGQAQSAEAPAADRLLLTLRVGDGERPPGDVFAAKDAVHLQTRLAEGSAAQGDVDLAFVVIDEQGNPLSSDALDCRRFRVDGEHGGIAEVYAGVEADGSPCQHEWSVQDGGALLPRLAPFADVAPSASGVMAYAVLVARVEDIRDGAFPEAALRAAFHVQAAAEPSCGDGHVDDGEECDDGNAEGGDGCTGCKVDPQPECCDGDCCGNGRIDPGEECDDGNARSGDGCSETCEIDIIP
jgi:cysteine-rich repeat protein